MVLNAGIEVTGWTVWVKTMMTGGDDAAGAEPAGEETAPPADEAMGGEPAGGEAMLDEGMRGEAGEFVATAPGEVSVAVTGQTVVYR